MPAVDVGSAHGLDRPSLARSLEEVGVHDVEGVQATLVGLGLWTVTDRDVEEKEIGAPGGSPVPPGRPFINLHIFCIEHFGDHGISWGLNPPG